MPQNPPPVKTAPRTERRAERRADMVQAAMNAVRRHGAGVSVAEIAAAAGITKPVLYRHFTDRADLRRAVGEQAAALLLARITSELDRDREPVEHIRAIIEAFLAGIEDEPELWRFVVHHPAERTPGAEIVDDVRQQVARLLATLLGERLRSRGLDSGGAEAWAHGLVGMVQSAGDWWLERRTMSSAALTDYLTTFIWGGLSGVPAGAKLPPSALRLVPAPDPKENRHA
ncbi:MAG: TetR/AcrR family transcriptional regulator [Pseudonocardia sp.]